MRKLVEYLFYIILFIKMSVAVAQPYPSVENMLAAQKIIRVFADASPGMGNQAATANVVSRLREWGFKGQVEFIYGKVVVDKITTLYDLPKDIPGDYFDAKNNIRFLQIKEHLARFSGNKAHDNIVQLGLSGSNDSGVCSVASKDGIELDSNDPRCLDEANFMGVKVFVTFNPYPPGTTGGHLTNFQLADPAPPRKPYWPYQADSDTKYFSMRSATLDDVKDYLRNDARGQELLKQRPVLSTLMAVLEDKTKNVMPAYGWPLQIPDGTHTECVAGRGFPGCFPGNILQLLTAAHYTQVNAHGNLANPLIIPVFVDYRVEMQTLLNIVEHDDWGQYAQAGTAEARTAIQLTGLNGKVFIGDLSDQTGATDARIRNLKPGEILILSMGSLPKNVFDGLYNYTDVEHIWPQIREGANSFDSLILTGRPHIRCYPQWEMGYKNITDASLQEEMRSLYDSFQDYKAIGICAGMDTWQFNPEQYKLLSKFINAAADKNSAFSQYFVDRAAEASDYKHNDRIYYGLTGALQYMDVNH